MHYQYGTPLRTAGRGVEETSLLDVHRFSTRLDRSRGGLSAKIHLGVDGRGRRLSILITPGQAGDNPMLWDVSKPSPFPPPSGTRRHPDLLLPDRGYAHDSTRTMLRRHVVERVIPQRCDQIARRKAKGSRGGRPPSFNKYVYKRRNVVERCFNRLKQ